MHHQIQLPEKVCRKAHAEPSQACGFGTHAQSSQLLQNLSTIILMLSRSERSPILAPRSAAKPCRAAGLVRTNLALGCNYHSSNYFSRSGNRESGRRWCRSSPPMWRFLRSAQLLRLTYYVISVPLATRTALHPACAADPRTRRNVRIPPNKLTTAGQDEQQHGDQYSRAKVLDARNQGKMR